MLLTGKEKREIVIRTPKGIPWRAKICDTERQERAVSCAVKKDGGDDPDVTTGFYIRAKVFFSELSKEQDGGLRIFIDGGEGVGRVTRPGLDQPVGNAAINHVPREMIGREVKEVCEAADFNGVLMVEISVPGGGALAAKTFNPRLGIEGGISILGTTGIVEPMSEKALLDTILTELKQHRAFGKTCIAVSPGNYGLEFMKRAYGYDLDRSVKCGNFIGNTIDMAADCGFTQLLLTGHIGKLIKVSGGIMNTHSREGDCRMELLCAAALLEGVEAEMARRILGCAATEAGLHLLKETGRLPAVMDRIMDKICFYLQKRAAGKMQTECILYSNEYGELAASTGAQPLLKRIKEEDRNGIFRGSGNRRA